MFVSFRSEHEHLSHVLFLCHQKYHHPSMLSAHFFFANCVFFSLSDNLDSVQIEQHMGDDEEVDIVDQDQAIDIVGPSGEEIEATGRSEGKLHDEGDDDAHDLDDPSGGIATGDVDLSIRDDR
mmetsp:Transcript_6230/g.12375  ORF Transcript_6230/g.12375 Transcript_6230/m.12375 type:complete len:123 (-) Transcript_6230:105-473(-)